MIQNKLLNGNRYTLNDLFSGDRKIIIPDLQRDYTWGDEKHGSEKTELVSGFCNSLFEQYTEKPDDTIQLGMIYAYENPINFVNLADGQQRITTLFLTIGVLYKKTKADFLKQKLISDFELYKDDKEPYLQYAIRETTLYFLSDLVCEFFLTENYKVEEIKKQKWYFKEYDNDPSIQSMLNAVKIIEKVLSDKTDLKHFAEWVIKKVEFFYFDMVNRQHGEEMFVVINTTGEPLTPSENLKPILLGNIVDEKYNKQWEDREKYFWQNKKSKEQDADAGLLDLFTWHVEINDRKDTTKADIFEYFSTKKRKIQNELDSLHKTFESLKLLLSKLNNIKIRQQLKYIYDKEIKTVADLRNFSKDQQRIIILPLIAYLTKFGDNEILFKFLRRLRKNYFDKLWTDRNKNHLDWRYVLQIVDKVDNSNDVLTYEGDFKKIQNINLSNWYNSEEKIKDKIANRQKIEEWEDYQDFMGDISILLKSAKIKDNDYELLNIKDENIEIEAIERGFKNYKNTIGIFHEEKQRNENYEISNLFRLFRLYSGIIKIGHIGGTAGITGVQFSTYNREHFNNLDFLKLISNPDLTNSLHEYIKTYIKKDNDFEIKQKPIILNAAQLIKIWLTLKVYYANQNKTILGFYEGNNTGVAAYHNLKWNKLFDNFDLSIENSICGFAVRGGFGRFSYIHYTNNEYWNKPYIIDTTFAGIPFNNYELRYKEEKIIEGKEDWLLENKMIIDKLIEEIMK